jgi:hypothetical protein
MKHNKENLIYLLNNIINLLDNSYNNLSQSGIDYIYHNLKSIDSIISSTSSTQKENHEIYTDEDINNLNSSQLLLKLQNHSEKDSNNTLDDLDDLLDL